MPPAPGVATAAEWICAAEGLRRFRGRIGRRRAAAGPVGLGLRCSSLALCLRSTTRDKTLAGSCGCSLLDACELLGNAGEPLGGFCVYDAHAVHELCAYGAHALHELTGHVGVSVSDRHVHGGDAVLQLLELAAAGQGLLGQFFTPASKQCQAGRVDGAA